MDVAPISRLPAASSSHSQPSDSSLSDPSGFGSMLGDIDANTPDSGGAAGGAPSGASGPPVATRQGKNAPANPEGGPANGTADKGKAGSAAGDTRPAKAADSAKGASPANGSKGSH